MKLYKLYNLDGSFINSLNFVPENFTGITEYLNGSKTWYFNGRCHRLGGAACEYADGSKEWFVGGKRHRIDGPAIVWADGKKHWFVDGKNATEKQCKFLYDIMKLKGLL